MDEVKLPTLLSLRPGVYILILLVIVISAAIFFVAFYPGIVKGGRYVTFSSPLSESGVYVDDRYVGAAGYQYFIESGDHVITIKKAGITIASYQLSIDHPVFLTWLFHRTLQSDAGDISLTEQQKNEIIRFNLEELASQSAILSFDSVNRYQPVFSNLINDLKALDLPLSRIQDAIELALLYTTSIEMADEASQMLQENPGLVNDKINSILASIQNVFDEESSSERIGTQEKISLQTALERDVLEYGEISIPGYRYPAASFMMGTETSLRYPDSMATSIDVEVPQFNLASLPVSQYQWALFLEENPYWDKANKTTLINEGLVDDQYLEGITPTTVFVTSRPIINVSYHAAIAFAQWLSEKTGKQVVLPTEAMWAFAAQSRSSTSYDSSLIAAPSTRQEPSALLGGVWEITQTPFIPLSRLIDYTRALDLHRQFGLVTQPIVKGGSYLNDPNTITPYTVGVVEPDVCGDQLGFRIAWYE